MEYVVDKDGKNVLIVASSMQGGEHVEHGGPAAAMGHTLDDRYAYL